MPGKCDICGKSFLGHEPLTDGKRYFHKKCAPEIDYKALPEMTEKMFGDLQGDGKKP